MANEVIVHIFSNLLKGYLTKFSVPINEILDSLMSMTLNVYIRVIKELLPTPTKSHYTFNLRDISKII